MMHTINIEVEVEKNPRYFIEAKPHFSHRIPHKVIVELLGDPQEDFEGRFFWYLNINGQEIYVQKAPKQEGEEEKVYVWASERHIAYDYFGMLVYSSYGKSKIKTV